MNHVLRDVVVIAVLLFGLTSCATSLTKTNELSVGMTKAEVIEILGTPESTRAVKGTEYLTYALGGDFNTGRCVSGTLITLGLLAPDFCQRSSKPFVVRLVDGKVDAYGKPGDFDLNKNPTTDINLSVK